MRGPTVYREQFEAGTLTPYASQTVADRIIKSRLAGTIQSDLGGMSTAPNDSVSRLCLSSFLIKDCDSI